MRYFSADHEWIETDGNVGLIVRGTEIPATVVELPFVKHNYKR